MPGPMMMKNSHTAANESDCGLACINKIPIGRMNVTSELSRTVKAIIPFWYVSQHFKAKVL